MIGMANGTPAPNGFGSEHPNPLLKEYIVLRNRVIPNIGQIEVYLENGGYETARTVLTTMQPDAVVNQVKASGLRGRGGAGFPTGVKWGFIPKDIFPKYLVCNADESEPGTFNNHEIIDYNPHQLVEGLIISGFAVGATTGYIYIRGEYAYGARVLERAIGEAYAQGFLGKNLWGSGVDFDLYVHRGAGAYICGEETALLESLEGKIGQPRLRPPFPAVKGLYAKPTVVNNVQTITNVPLIMKNGADWYRTFGTEKSPGTFAISISGHVKRPGNYEIPLDTTCPVAAAMKIDEFFKHESCGKCTPCREGTHFLTKVWERIEHGHGRVGDIALLGDVAKEIGSGPAHNCFCLLGPSSVSAVNSALKYFTAEIQAHIDTGRCPLGYTHPMPRISSAEGGTSTGQAPALVH